MGVTLINDLLPDEAIDVPPESAVHYRRSGWYRPGDDKPAAAELASYRQEAGPTPEDMRPKLVTIYHPGNDATAEVAESAVTPFRGAGWVTQAEWDEAQGKTAETPDEAPAGDDPVTAPARAGGAPQKTAGSASTAGGTDKE